METIAADNLYPARSGVVTAIDDVSLSVSGPLAKRGEVWKLRGTEIFGEVSRTSRDGFVVSLYSRTESIVPGSRIDFHLPRPMQSVGDMLLGRILDGLGNPIDGSPKPTGALVSLDLQRVNPMDREIIDTPLETGVRAIDGMMTIGCGQKIGLFAPSGVGKSVLLGMIARGTDVDVLVIAMTGERGREVREFIETSLADALARSIVFVSPSDSPPLTKLSGLQRAIVTARHFAEQGKNVLLLVDSLTRVATALRDLGLASGEAPVTRGYTPSMYNYFPTILEQAGKFKHGSLTMITTVLVEDSEDTDPVATTARAILDGHIVLSPELARSAHYPAIDVLRSRSRVMPSVIDERHRQAYREVISLYSLLKEYEDIVNMGLYRKGTNPRLDLAIVMAPRIDALLQQDREELTPLDNTTAILETLADEIRKSGKNT